MIKRCRKKSAKEIIGQMVFFMVIVALIGLWLAMTVVVVFYDEASLARYNAYKSSMKKQAQLNG